MATQTTGRNGGQGQESRIGISLPADSDQRHIGIDAAPPELGESVLPQLDPAQEPDDDEVSTADIGDRLDPIGMEPPHGPQTFRYVLEDRTQREQLGVGVGPEDDHDTTSARIRS